MTNSLKSFGPVGSLDFPLSEKQARNLDTLLKALPKSKEFKDVKTVFLKAPTELNSGERSDVSWISTKTPDRYDHFVFAKGMNDSQFALNPIVTLNHDYTCPPIGRSLWRKFVKDGDTRGIKAKSVDPPMPASWTAGECWEPDKVFAQSHAGLLKPKSIGWLPTKAHFADVKEAAKNNWREGTLVVEEWLLIEYAVGTIPVNPETVVEVVSNTIPGAEPVPFVTLAELEKSMQKRIESIDITGIVQESLARIRGRVSAIRDSI
jgi:hypothetical protein